MKTQSPTVPIRSCRGVRGATTVRLNTPEAIFDATRELLERMASANNIDSRDIASVFFTTTLDLNAAYPAAAARALGWVDVPLLCAQEIAVPGGLPRVVRVLIHWNTSVVQADIKHLYINGAEILRPDHAKEDVRNDYHNV